MNFIFPAMIIIAIIFSFINRNPDAVINAGFEGCAAAVKSIMSFGALMCFWSGILNVLQKSGGDRFIKKLLSPLIRRLFPNSGEKSREYISLNLSANLLGMGNAATPMGIKAMEALDRENNFSPRPSKNMCMLVAINTTSIQLIPTTVISLRAAAGSVSPAQIIPFVWITSVCSFLVSVFIIKVFYRK